jgi:hypothetical protein
MRYIWQTKFASLAQILITPRWQERASTVRQRARTDAAYTCPRQIKGRRDHKTESHERRYSALLTPEPLTPLTTDASQRQHAHGANGC